MTNINDMFAQSVDRITEARDIRAERAAAEKKNQEKALAAFVKANTEAALIARKITAALDDHLGVDPDSVTWANEGTASKVLSDLKAIAKFLKIKT